MSKIDLRFAEIHAPLFLMGEKGTNLTTKLDPAKRKGLKLVYDRGEKELLVSFEGMSAIIPSTNIVSMMEVQSSSKKLDAKTLKALRKENTPTGQPIVAQVSGPQSHVHAGPGHGQTGQDAPKAKK